MLVNNEARDEETIDRGSLQNDSPLAKGNENHPQGKIVTYNS